MVETAALRGLGDTAAIGVDGQRREDLDGLLGRGGRGLDVAGVVGRDAVEAVGVAGLAGERGRGVGRRDGRQQANGPPSVES